jgi:hypothetical protein
MRHRAATSLFPVCRQMGSAHSSVLGNPPRRQMSTRWSQPSPLPLPPNEQREFEQLQKEANKSSSSDHDSDLQHPDARQPLPSTFEGDINPETGEQGGPKREPVGRWGDGLEDWSHKGRVSDF